MLTMQELVNSLRSERLVRIGADANNREAAQQKIKDPDRSVPKIILANAGVELMSRRLSACGEVLSI